MTHESIIERYTRMVEILFSAGYSRLHYSFTINNCVSISCCANFWNVGNINCQERGRSHRTCSLLSFVCESLDNQMCFLHEFRSYKYRKSICCGWTAQEAVYSEPSVSPDWDFPLFSPSRSACSDCTRVQGVTRKKNSLWTQTRVTYKSQTPIFGAFWRSGGL